MRMWLGYTLALLAGLHGSNVEGTNEVEKTRKRFEKAFSCKLSDEEVEIIRKSLVEVSGLETRILLPLIFHDRKLVASPVAKYRDINEREREYVEKVVRLLPYLAWRSVALVCAPGNWTLFLMYDVFKTTSFKDFDPVVLYRESKGRSRMRLMDLVVEIFKRNNCMVSRFGQGLAREAEVRIQGISSSLSAMERKREEEMLRKIKEHGERLCTKKNQEQIIEAQKIMCDACEYIWKREENRKSFVMGAHLKHLYLRMIDPSNDVEGPLLYYIDHEKMINTYEKYKSISIVAELVKKVVIEYEDINDESISSAVHEVKERESEEKRREEESLRNAEELLRMEEREKGEGKGPNGKGKKKRGKKGAGKAKEESKEEDRGEEEEESVEAEVPVEEMAAEGARPKKKRSKERSKGEDSCYRVHKRVLRWMKSVERIKYELDNGKEEKWKGKSMEEIEGQKVLHDIIEVLKLLRSRECDKFFVRTGKYMKGGSERWKMVALGILDEGGEKKVGNVEVGLFKGKREESVVYHLMFKPTSSEKTGKGSSPSFGKGDDVDEIEEDGSSDMSGFQYPPGVRSEVVKDKGEFRIVWRNPKDTSSVLRSLAVLQIPEIQ
ncbi:hypothetical protein [Encephalitozoon cuniculi GB-M1]|uniref:UPF0329 protein ECU06_1610 n=1 Tax=Encephalitozoon cuniculi (strain GB-M1) TaxID=284813 RepID=Y6G1_ENCCU|nr:uncharacterized protein ECU06_1610 [Encephalitozoon cuniculi GB-M1]Q8SV64.1 RecName: Full=UPF0329 protein ECU06_1610 [Encephalitozoon cuniculi GB-M1]CAD25522.1 hypothetical protein [Encephalitozoon cuniculi GB-M1]